MEDALAPIGVIEIPTKVTFSLNPCFNGRCTRTPGLIGKHCRKKTSLNPCFNGRCTRTMVKVTLEPTSFGKS